MKRAMRILITVAIAAGFFAASAAGLYAPDRTVHRDAPLNEFTEHLDSRIRKLMRQYTIPGVTVAVVQNGEIVYTMAYGEADRETGRKMTADMPVRVQSISKSVTAWAVLKLVEEGKLNLDDPVSKYIRDWEFPDSAYSPDGVTVRRLLCHTAGLPLGNVFSLYAPEEPTPSLKESLTESAVLFQKPGEGFSYSNVGYNLLELLIEEVTGRDFAEYMKSEILAPLGMNHSDFEWNAGTLAAAPLGYTLNGKAVSHYRYPERASGGLLSTAEDIARFCIAGMRHFSEQKILTHSGVEQLYSPQANRLGVYSMVFDAYGFGYYTERGPAVSHGGQGTGWMSHFHAAPETGDAIVILTNSQRSWPFIAGVLNGWARWRGFPALGMTRILLGECILWALVGLIIAAAFFQIISMGIRLAGSNINFVPLQLGRIRIHRKAQFGISIAVLGGLLWCASQRYLFLTSVFPTVSWWLGVCTAVLMALLLIASFRPGILPVSTT
jgi:CubicO group peptidase (beta-lactamase class C family)